MSDQWILVLRKKLTWLEGFAAAINNNHLEAWVHSFKRGLNKIEVGDDVIDRSEVRKASRRIPDVEDAM